MEAAIDDVIEVDCAACSQPVPGEVANLRLALSAPVAELSWDAEPVAASYDVYRGTMGDASDLACFASGVTTTSSGDDGALPATGEGLFYVVTAVNCAGESPLGQGRTAAGSCP